MKNKELDLKKIKVAIFDFDSTLAIHRDKEYINHRNESEEKQLNYYLNAYLNPAIFYETIEPCDRSESLYKLICYFKKNKVKLYCVSGMKFSFHLKAKEAFVHKQYDSDMEVISTRSQELKIDAVKIIQRLHNCALEEILFVDDMEINVNRMRAIGIHAFLPEEVDQMKIE